MRDSKLYSLMRQKVGPAPVGKQIKEKFVLFWVATAITLLLVIAISVLIYGGENNWIGHAITSIGGLILIIIAIINGATLTGRLKRAGTTNAFNLHKHISVLFSLFMVGTFFFGLWVTSQHDEGILSSVHGWLGLAIVILAVLQLVPCFASKRRAKVRLPHMIIGYTTALLVIIQIAWGLEIAVVGAVKDLVMIHSTFGAIAALASTWIIVEMHHLTPKGLARAKFAGYIGAPFNIVGCWIVGGYNYLTVYGSQLKPVILEGAQPWAHQIIMETKEHVFLFLPVISLALMLTLNLLGKDQTLLEEPKARKSIIAIALLALTMIVLSFVFGALISNAAKIGVGGK